MTRLPLGLGAPTALIEAVSPADPASALPGPAGRLATTVAGLITGSPSAGPGSALTGSILIFLALLPILVRGMPRLPTLFMPQSSRRRQAATRRGESPPRTSSPRRGGLSRSTLTAPPAPSHTVIGGRGKRVVLARPRDLQQYRSSRTSSFPSACRGRGERRQP